MDATSEIKAVTKNNVKQELRQLQASYLDLNKKLNSEIREPLSELR